LKHLSTYISRDLGGYGFW